MKKESLISQLRSEALCALCVLCVSLLAPSVQADSFNCTNFIPSGSPVTPQVLAGYGGIFPTNAAGTLTGGAISVANQEWAGFFFQAQGVCTNTANPIGAGNIYVSLTRSLASNPPGVTTGTNGATGNTTVLLASDWESSGVVNGSVVFPNTILLTIPVSGTNAITWSTNLDRWTLGGAQWVGISGITNSCTNMFLTNVVIGLNKKIIPIRFP